MRDSVARALSWLDALLRREGIEYQVVGGLAANIHGGSREVADIDLYVRDVDIGQLLPHLTPYISRPLDHYKEHGWDLHYLQLVYHSQKIEIGLSDYCKIQSATDGRWHKLVIDYSSSVMGQYQGIQVPVIPVHHLIAYKQRLNREVDRIDIEELSRIKKG